MKFEKYFLLNLFDSKYINGLKLFLVSGIFIDKLHFEFLNVIKFHLSEKG
jgi:hypothetical protein